MAFLLYGFLTIPTVSVIFCSFAIVLQEGFLRVRGRGGLLCPAWSLIKGLGFRVRLAGSGLGLLGP